MKKPNKECAITGQSLGTDGHAVQLVGGPVGGSQYLCPTICASLVRVLGGVNIAPVEVYDPHHETFDIGGLTRRIKKDGMRDTALKAIYVGFRAHLRASRFLMENLGVPHDKLSSWQKELDQGKPQISADKSSGRRPLHFH